MSRHPHRSREDTFPIEEKQRQVLESLQAIHPDLSRKYLVETLTAHDWDAEKTELWLDTNSHVEKTTWATAGERKKKKPTQSKRPSQAGGGRSGPRLSGGQSPGHPGRGGERQQTRREPGVGSGGTRGPGGTRGRGASSDSTRSPSAGGAASAVRHSGGPGRGSASPSSPTSPPVVATGAAAGSETSPAPAAVVQRVEQKQQQQQQQQRITPGVASYKNMLLKGVVAEPKSATAETGAAATASPAQATASSPSPSSSSASAASSVDRAASGEEHQQQPGEASLPGVEHRSAPAAQEADTSSSAVASAREDQQQSPPSAQTGQQSQQHVYHPESVPVAAHGVGEAAAARIDLGAHNIHQATFIPPQKSELPLFTSAEGIDSSKFTFGSFNEDSLASEEQFSEAVSPAKQQDKVEPAAGTQPTQPSSAAQVHPQPSPLQAATQPSPHPPTPEADKAAAALRAQAPYPTNLPEYLHPSMYLHHYLPFADTPGAPPSPDGGPAGHIPYLISPFYPYVAPPYAFPPGPTQPLPPYRTPAPIPFPYKLAPPYPTGPQPPPFSPEDVADPYMYHAYAPPSPGKPAGEAPEPTAAGQPPQGPRFDAPWSFHQPPLPFPGH